MCLVTLQSAPFIAEENLVVYKLLRPNCWKPRGLTDVEWELPNMYKTPNPNVVWAMWQPFSYEVGKLYSTEITLSDKIKYFDIVAGDWYQKYLDDNKILYAYECGFHSITEDRGIDFINHNKMRDVYLYRCIIPKGSEYYQDETDQFVSNQIIIKQRIL